MEEDLIDRLDREFLRVEDKHGPEPELVDWGGQVPKEAYLYVVYGALGLVGNGGVIELASRYGGSWDFLVESFLFFEFEGLAETLRKVPEVHKKFTEQYGDQDVFIGIINEWFGELDMPFFDAVTDFESETYEQIARIYFEDIENQ